MTSSPDQRERRWNGGPSSPTIASAGGLFSKVPLYERGTVTQYHLAVRFAEQARRYASRDCLVMGGQRLTYEQVDGESAALAVALSDLGVQAGDRIAIDLPNRIEWVTAFLAVARLGGIVVPVNPALGYHELKYQLRHAEASIAVAADAMGGLDYAELFDDLVGELSDLRLVVAVGSGRVVVRRTGPAVRGPGGQWTAARGYPGSFRSV